MAYEAGEGVRYTVREVLDQMRDENRRGHEELVRKIDGVKRDVRDLSKRVDSLEDERIRRDAVMTFGGRAWVAMVAGLGVVVNIPAMLYFIRGPH